MLVLGHIAGMPIEETALSFGPVIAAGGGIATLKLRERLSPAVIRRRRGAESVPMSFSRLLHANRAALASVPRWALPFYMVAAACVLLFAVPIWLVASFCMSMRPLYEGRGK